MRVVLVVILLCALVSHPAVAQTPAGGDVWRAFAERIDPGSRIKVRMRDGQRVTATFIQAGADALLVQPRTRVPVPVQRVPYDEIASMERDEGRGIGAGKAVALGVASGVAAFLGTLMIMIATID